MLFRSCFASILLCYVLFIYNSQICFTFINKPYQIYHDTILFLIEHLFVIKKSLWNFTWTLNQISPTFTIHVYILHWVSQADFIIVITCIYYLQRFVYDLHKTATGFRTCIYIDDLILAIKEIHFTISG